MSSDRKHIITKCCCLQLSPHLSFSAIRAEHWTAPRLLSSVFPWWGWWQVCVSRCPITVTHDPGHTSHVTPGYTQRMPQPSASVPVCVGRTLSLGFQSLLTILILTCIYFLSLPTTLKYPSHEAASRWILIGTFFSAALSPVTRTAAPSLTVLKLAASHSFFPLNTLRPGRLLFV